MQNMFLNPFEVPTSKLCKESYVLFDILDLEDYQSLLGLRKTLIEEYDDNIFDKFTFVNMMTNESINKYYLKSNIAYRVL